jgi:beta-glucosidase
VVGVIFGGRPLALGPIEPYLDAILYAWHCGTETAHAACDILFGDVNPSGKSAVTFVKTTGHIPLYYNQLVPAKKIHSYYGAENVMKGIPASSGYLDVPAVPMYPFGFGLSYTTFEISKPTVDNTALSADEIRNGNSFSVSVTVKNTGTKTGKETVQLYIHDVIASYIRPQKELKGFKKIELEAGEEKTVTFHLGYDELGFFDERGKYLLENGEFEVFVGDDCMTNNKTVITLQN